MDDLQLRRIYNQESSYHSNPPSFETWKEARKVKHTPSTINSPNVTPEPSTHEIIVTIRDALGLFSGAMPSSPKEVWEETLRLAAIIKRDHDRYLLLRYAARESDGRLPYVAYHSYDKGRFPQPHTPMGEELDMMDFPKTDPLLLSRLRESTQRVVTPEEHFEQSVSWVYSMQGKLTKDEVREMLRVRYLYPQQDAPQEKSEQAEATNRWSLRQLKYAHEVCFPDTFISLWTKYDEEGTAYYHLNEFKRQGGLLP